MLRAGGNELLCKEAMDMVLEQGGVGAARSKQRDFSGAKAGFFHQFSGSRFRRRFPGIHHPGGKFRRELILSVPPLPYQHKAAPVDGHHHDPVRGGYGHIIAFEAGGGDLRLPPHVKHRGMQQPFRLFRTPDQIRFFHDRLLLSKENAPCGL